MTQSHLALLLVFLFSTAALAHAEDAAPTPLQKKLIGHWVADKDKQYHVYFSQKHRLVDYDVASTDAVFSMGDYSIFEEWAELRTIILTVNENTVFEVMLVITVSEDGHNIVCREKTAKGWVRSFKLRRIDDKTHPSKLPERIKITDLEKGLGSEQE